MEREVIRSIQDRQKLQRQFLEERTLLVWCNQIVEFTYWGGELIVVDKTVKWMAIGLLQLLGHPTLMAHCRTGVLVRWNCIFGDLHFIFMYIPYIILFDITNQSKRYFWLTCMYIWQLVGVYSSLTIHFCSSSFASSPKPDTSLDISNKEVSRWTSRQIRRDISQQLVVRGINPSQLEVG